MAVRSWIRNLFAGKASKTRASADRRGLSRKPRRTHLCLEALENRLAPAVTTFSGGILTVDLNNASEAATLSNDGANISLTSNNAITGAGASFATANVTKLVLTDAGNNAGQSIDFAGSAAYSLSGGLDSSGVETNTFDDAVTATGAASISVTAPQNIIVNKNLTGGTGGTTLQALGAAALNTVGVTVQAGAVVTATGSGTVTVQGTGGAGSGSANFGVYVTGSGSTITSGGGAVQVAGQGGGGTTHTAVVLASSGTITTATNGGSITVRGDSMDLAGGTINAGSNTVTLTPKTSGTAINLGGADAAGTLGLTDAELDVITAGTLVIGRNDIATGTVTVTSAVAPALANALSVITARDIIVNANLTGGSGGLGLSANRQATPTDGDFVGVTVQAGAVVATTGSGAVSLAGTGGSGTGAGNHGIFINGGIVQAGGSGTITLAGTGSVSDTSAGVRITGGGRVTAGGGDPTRSLGLAAGSAILVDLDAGRATSSGYDFLQVEGTVDLGGALLQGTATGAIPFLTPFTLLDNDLGDAVFGTFAQGGSVILGGQSFSINYTGNDGNDVILTADEPPTDIALSNSSVAANQPAGTVVGAFSTTDPDSGDSFTYSLVSGSKISRRQAIVA